MNSVDGNKDAQGNPLVYADGLKMNRKVIWKGVEQSISAITASIPVQDWKEIRRSITRSGISRRR